MNSNDIKQDNVTQPKETQEQPKQGQQDQVPVPAEDEILKQILADLGVAAKKVEENKEEDKTKQTTTSEGGEAAQESAAGPLPDKTSEQEGTGEKSQPEKAKTEEKKTRVFRKKPDDFQKVIREETAKIIDEIKGQKLQPPAQETPKPERAAEEEIDTTDWEDDEKEELEFLKIAASVDEKYKDLPKKFADARAKVVAWLEKRTAENPDVSEEELEEEVAKYAETVLPKELKALRDSDKERIRIMVKHQLSNVVPEIQKPAIEKIQEMERHLAEIKAAPKVEESIKWTKSRLDEFLKRDGTSEIIEKATKSENSRLGQMVNALMGQVDQYAKRFAVACHDPTRRLNPNDPMDATIIQFIQNAGEMFAKEGQGLERNGATFLPLYQYMSVPEKDRAKYWTFDEKDVLTLVAHDVSVRLKSLADIAKELGEFQKSSTSTLPQQKPQVPQQQRSPSPSPPVVAPTPISNAGSPPSAPGMMTKEEIGALGISLT